jgi:molecular chaperone DnaJ
VSDYYALLEVSSTASADDIKKAYRRLARVYHPDVNPDPEAEARFKEISKAYETLSDPQRRARYDRFGPEDGAGAGGFPGGGFGNFDDLFSMVFDNLGFGAAGGARGRGGRRAGPPRGSDLETTVELSFEEAIFGVAKDVTIRTAVGCETCSGSGAAPGSAPQACVQCGGTGQVHQSRPSLLGQLVTSGPCPRCQASGQIIPEPCPDCRGEGRVVGEHTYSVEIPGGVDSGTTLRLAGRGAVGPRGGAAGDLYVHIRVAAHAYLRREGDHLLHRLSISVTQAALGVTLPYATLDGEEQLVVPPGTQSGHTVRFRGRGSPQVQGRGRGDLLVELVVETPTGLSEEQEELLRRLAELRGETVAPPDKGLFARLRSAMR